MIDFNRNAPAILRRHQVEREVGLSRTTIYRRIREGTFPAPIKLGRRAVGWRAADIERFLSDPAGYRSTTVVLGEDESVVAPVCRSTPGRGA